MIARAKPIPEPNWIELFTPKLVTTLQEGYGAGHFRADAIAGLTVAIVALPLSIAIAIASGVSPAQGLYTAIVGGFLVSALGGSRFQIGGPAGAFIVLVSGHGGGAWHRRPDPRHHHFGSDPDRRRLPEARHLCQIHSLSRHRGVHCRHRDHHLRKPDKGIPWPDARRRRAWPTCCRSCRFCGSNLGSINPIAVGLRLPPSSSLSS